MAVTDQQKLDFLLKKIGYTKTKTGSVVGTGAISGTPKQPFAEAIPSPLIIANGALWNESDQIPTTPPGSDTTQVKVYLAASSGLRMTADSTSSGQRAYIAYSTYNDTSSTRLTNWIDTQFGSAYLIKVYKGDPNSGGVALSAAGSGSNDGWFFDYSAGVLNFNDTSVPSGVTDTNIYIVGYRYIGLTGAPTPTGGGNFTFNDLVVSRNFQVAGLSTFNGLVDINAGGQANTFKVEDLTDNRIVIAGTGGELEDSANLTFDGSTLGVTGDATFSGNVSIGGTLTYEDVKNVDAVGLITARSGIRVTGGVIEALAGENKIPSLYSNMGALPAAGSYHGMFAHVHATGRGYFAHAGNWLELVNKEVNGVVGTGTERYNIGPVDLTTLDVSGISTFAGNVDINADIDVDGHTNLDNVSIAGVTTITQDLDVDGHTNLDNVSVAGITTFSGIVDAINTPASIRVAQDIQHKGDADTKISFPSADTIRFDTAGTQRLNIASNGNISVTNDFDVDGHTNLDNVSIAGFTTITQDLDVDGHTNLDNVSISGVTSVASLTSGRVVTVGTAGKLQDSNNLTFDGSNLFVSGINITGGGATSILGADIVTRNLKATGLSTFVGQSEFDGNAKFDSTITAGGSAGSNGQYLKTTGSGVEWASFPTLRTRQTFTASSGQTAFSFSYTINFIDVFVNGIKLTDAEFTATNGSTVVLAVGCFVGDIVELVSYNTVSGGGGGGGGGGISNVVEDTTPQLGGNLDLFNKSITGTGNVNITGIITATNFIGDGSGLTGVTASGSGVIVKDSGSVVGTAQTIDFGSNLSVSPASAGIVTVSTDFSNLNATGVSTFAGITSFTNNTHFGGVSKTYTFYGHPNTPDYYMQWNTAGSGYLKFQDGVHSYYGTNNRTHIDPHGSGSNGHFRIEQYMTDGNNPLKIHSDFTNIVGSPTNGHESRSIADFEYAEGASLYYTGTKRLQTSGVGVTVTGSLDVSDIRSDALTLKNAAGSASYAVFSNGGSALLKHNNTDRLETSASGVTVTGTVAATAYTGDGSQLTGIVAGISTISGVVNVANDLDVDGHTNLDNVSIAGVTTFASAIDLNADLDVDGHTNLDNVNIAGVVTATTFSGAFIGNGSGLTGVVASGSGIVVKDDGSTVGTAGTVNFTEPITVTPISAGITTVGINTSQFNVQKLNVSGITTTYQLSVGGGGVVFNSNSIYGSSKLIISGGGGGDTNYYSGGTAYSDHIFRTIQGGSIIERFRINSNAAISVAGSYGTAGQVLTSNGSGSASTWTTVSGGGGGTDVGITTNLSGSFTASAGTPATINTFAYHDNDKVVEYTVYIKNGSDFQSQKLLAMRDGTTIHSTQFAVMFSSSLLVQCDATISSGNILLRATPETGVSGSTTYKIKREVM